MVTTKVGANLQATGDHAFYVGGMTNDQTTSELPIFPATAPVVFGDRAATRALFTPVLDQLAAVVGIDDELLQGPTPCDGFTVEQLRTHVLAWLQFFATSLAEATAAADSTERVDPETWRLAADQDPGAVVSAAAVQLLAAADAGAAEQLVVMSQARMTGDCVLAMALGEYLVHGWDLATATGQPWTTSDDAAEAALDFLKTTVAPEYRGPDSGFFGHEVPAPEGAGPFEQLLCFTGRDPQWTPPTGA